MAFATITFRHRESGELKVAPIGFSWTTFFFGFIPALLRGHRQGAVVLALTGLVTLGLANIVAAFLYNRWYVRHLVRSGFKVRRATRDVTLLGQELRMDFLT